jgi:uncharacterized membrane protein YedE/YeeE
MLSGIGPAGHLKVMGVPVVADRPGVGGNLHDQQAVALRWRALEPALGLAESTVSAGMFTVSLNASPPDLQMDYLDPRAAGGPLLGIDVILTQPTSRGEVRLASADPQAAPAVRLNALATEADVTALVQGVRLARFIAASPQLDRLRGDETAETAAAVPLAALQALVKQAARARAHLAGTCAMGRAVMPRGRGCHARRARRGGPPRGGRRGDAGGGDRAAGRGRAHDRRPRRRLPAGRSGRARLTARAPSERIAGCAAPGPRSTHRSSLPTAGRSRRGRSRSGWPSWGRRDAARHLRLADGRAGVGTAAESRACPRPSAFTSAWRVLIADGRGEGVRAQMLLLALTCAVFFPLLAQGQAFGVPLTGLVQPPGVPVAVGAFIFGIGMQLGGGCASGTLFSVGGGSPRMLVTLAAFIAGSVAATAHNNYWASLPSFPATSLVTHFGPVGALAGSLVVFGAIFVATVVIERRRFGALVETPLPARRPRWLRGPWPLAAGAIGLALVNLGTLLLAGRPWGIRPLSRFGARSWRARWACRSRPGRTGRRPRSWPRSTAACSATSRR